MPPSFVCDGAGDGTKAGRHKEAVAWAERGLEAFPNEATRQLREFLVREYVELGRDEDALAQAWVLFEETPSLETYRRLREQAEKRRAWGAWRDRALEHLRAQIAARPADSAAPSWSSRAGMNSVLVQILLWEKDAEAAWREARANGCSDPLWLDLARLREGELPEDAIAVLREQVEHQLARKNDDAYREAMELLRRIRGLSVRLAREGEYALYLASVRQQHARKRNFTRLLDAEAWDRP